MSRQYPSIVDAIAPVLSQYLSGAQQRSDQKIRNARQMFEDKMRARAEQIASENANFGTDEGLLRSGFSVDSIARARAAGTPGTQPGMVFPNLSILAKAEDPQIAKNRSFVEANKAVIPSDILPFASSGEMSSEEIYRNMQNAKEQSALEKYRNDQLAIDRIKANKDSSKGGFAGLGNLSTFEQERITETALLKNPAYRKAKAQVDIIKAEVLSKRKALEELRSQALDRPSVAKKLPQAEKEYALFENDYLEKKQLLDEVSTRAWAEIFAPQFLQGDTTQAPVQAPDTNAFSPEFIEAFKQIMQSDSR